MIALTLIGRIAICAIIIISITGLVVTFYLIIGSIHEEIMNPNTPQDDGKVPNTDE